MRKTIFTAALALCATAVSGQQTTRAFMIAPIEDKNSGLDQGKIDELYDEMVQRFADEGETVVDRDEAGLNKRRNEIDAQRSKYIDDKTAAEKGKGKGATHIVSSFITQEDNPIGRKKEGARYTLRAMISNIEEVTAAAYLPLGPYNFYEIKHSIPGFVQELISIMRQREAGGSTAPQPIAEPAVSTDKAPDGEAHGNGTAKTCTVTFDKQDGTGGNSSVTVKYGSAMPPMGDAPTRKEDERDVYAFCGYYTYINGAGTRYYKYDSGEWVSARNWDIAGDTTLYARWTPATSESGISDPTQRILFSGQRIWSSGWMNNAGSPYGPSNGFNIPLLKSLGYKWVQVGLGLAYCRTGIRPGKLRWGVFGGSG